MTKKLLFAIVVISMVLSFTALALVMPVQSSQQIEAADPPPTAPSWKILVLIYQNTDFTFTDNGTQHHVVASMTQEEMDRATNASLRFFLEDVPQLDSGYMSPAVTIRYPQRTLDKLDGHYWPSRANTAAELDPAFDSVVVIWDSTGVDVNNNQSYCLDDAQGLTDTGRGTMQTYTTIPIQWVSSNNRNVFKHEWGHSICFYYDAAHIVPAINNHYIQNSSSLYVHCGGGEPYIIDPQYTDNDSIPNSTFNNSQGFTHDYYSGTTALPTNPNKCIGMNHDVWATGGPVSHPLNYQFNYYRQRFTIAGSPDGCLTNYQMKLIVHKGPGNSNASDVYLNNNCQDDFDDIRFTTSDSVTPLDYWIESYSSGNSTTVWVEIPIIPASPGSADFYIYYGNPTAASVSNGAKTFIIFNDTGSTEDWISTTSAWFYDAPTWSTSNGKIRAASGPASSSCGYSGILYFNDPTGVDSYKLHADIQASNGLVTTNEQQGLVTKTSQSMTDNAHARWIDGWQNYWQLDDEGSGHAESPQDNNFDASYVHEYLLTRDGSTGASKLYVDNNLKVTFNNTSWNPQYIGLHFYNEVSNRWADYDNISVSKFTTNEPYFSTWGGESDLCTPIYTLTVTCSDGGMVTTPSSGTFIYPYGNTILEATTNAHYQFVKWTGSAVDAGKVADPYSATTTIFMDGNYSVQANFAIDTSDFCYRQQFTIAGSPDGNLSNYQMKLTVHKGPGTSTGRDVYLNNHCQDDFDDIRFTMSDGATLLDYWIESYSNGNSSTIWVEIPIIPASPNSTSLYIYYGNPSATSASNGAHTFIIFNDTGSTEGWTSMASAWFYDAPTWSTSNGKIRATSDVYSCGWGYGGVLYYDTTTGVNSYRLHADIQASNGLVPTNEQQGFITKTSLRQGDNGHARWVETWCKFWQIYGEAGGNNVSAQDITFDASQLHEYVLTRDSFTGDSKLYVDNVWKVTYTNTSWQPQYIGLYFYNEVPNRWADYDNIFVGKFTANEPTFGAWGGEEASIKPWTYLVYIDADNDLEDPAFTDFLEMSSVGSNASVNILVQLDRLGGESDYGNWSTCKRFYVTNGMTPTVGNASSDIGEPNMGDPATLEGFIGWAANNYPANNYALVLWNHGHAWDGVCRDETSNTDYLEMKELQSALANTSNIATMDLVGFSACIMSWVEVGYQIRDYGPIMVGSQAEVDTQGWPQNTILNDLANNPGWNASQLGADIVNRFHEFYALSSVDEAYKAFSAVNLSSLNSLATNISTLADRIDNYWSTNVSAIRDSARSVMTGVNKSVISEWHSSKLPFLHGLSIFLPLNDIGSVPIYEHPYNGSTIDFPVDTQWDEFLNNLAIEPMNTSWIAKAADWNRAYHYEGDIYNFCETLVNYPFNMFAVGESGTIMHYNGTAWEAMNSGTTNLLKSVWGSSPSDVFAVGGLGTITHYNGSIWSTMDIGIMDMLWDVWGSNSSDVYVVSALGSIFYYNGSTWSTAYSNSSCSFGSIWGSSATDIFVSGAEGIVVHYNGSAWSQTADITPDSSDIVDIWGSSSSDVFAVGENGNIAHYNGNAWITMYSGTTELLWGVWGSSPTHVIAVGDNDTKLCYNGSTWSNDLDPSTVGGIYGVWGSFRNNAFAVGHDGTILRYYGTGWLDEGGSGTTSGLYGLWGSSERIDTFKLTYNSGPNGTISGTTPQTVNCGANGSAVTAVPNACYHFVNWSDGATTNPRTDTNVTGNITITANFAVNTVQLTTSSTGTSHPGSLTVLVNAGNDDAHETAAGGSFSATGTTVYLTSSTTASSRYNGGFVFDNVSIPKGATITSANISLYVSSTSYDDANVQIYGNNVDNAKDFTTEADVTSRICTTAYTSWVANSLGTGWKTSPSIVPVVQEIVNRGSWASGNSLGIIIKGNSNSAKSFRVYSYNQGTTYGAKLSITYTFTAGGSVTAPGQPGPYTYTCGTNVPIVATPNSGCYFVKWTGSGVTAGKVANPNIASTTLLMDGTYSVQANFTGVKRNLTTASTANGDVTTPGEPGPYSYGNGQMVSIVATPNPCYHFVNWTGSGVTAGKVANPNSASTTITMDGDYSVQANFAINQVALSTSSVPGGSVTAPGQPGPYTYNCGTNVPIAATPDSGYYFVRWTGSGVTAGKVANPYSPSTTITMDSDYSLQAYFTNVIRNLTTSSSAGGDVTTPGEPGPYTCGFEQVVNIVATPNPCYHFVNWTGSGVTAGKVANPNSASTTITMDGDYSVQANFAINTAPVQLTTSSTGTTHPGSFTIQLNAGNDDAHETAAGGSFSSTTTTVYLTSSATASSRYNGGFVFDNVAIPAGATITSANISLYVSSTLYDDANAKIYGNLVANANNFATEADVTSRICTTAYTSWVATGIGTGWKTSPSITPVIQEIVNGASWASGNSLGIIIKGNSDSAKSFRVYSYEQGTTYGAKLSITYTFTAGGSVTAPGQPGPYTYTCGTNVPIAATPNSGCHFVNWTGSGVTAGKVANPNSASTTILMDGNYSVQANFTKN